MKRSTILLAGLTLLLVAVVSGLLRWQREGAVRSPEQPRSSSLPAETNALLSRARPAQTAPPPATAATSVESSTSPQQPEPRDDSVVATAIGQGTQRDFPSRLEAISRLGTNLSARERQSLYAYLRDPRDEPSLHPGQNFALKNDILNVLRVQTTPPPELTDHLLALRRDESQPLVMRDYALQHLAPWYAQAVPAQREAIVAELHAAAAATSQSYAGTAFLGLNRIQQENPGAHLPPFTDQVIDLVEEGSADLLARITAVQLTGELGLQEAHESIRRLAADAAQPPPLRIAAVAALGKLGVRDDVPLLTQIAAARDDRLKRAATSALPRP